MAGGGGRQWQQLGSMLPRPRRRAAGEGSRILEGAASVADIRELARKKVPGAVFDYVDGAADAESSLQNNRAALESIEFLPRVLEGVDEVDLATTLVGRNASLPVVVGPTGYSRLMHHRGELAVVRAASEAGVPYVLSTMGTEVIESVREVAADAELWYQLYIWRDRERSYDLVRRARAVGVDVLVVTVDTPVGGRRLRDVRHGMTLPPVLTMKTMIDGARHPRWSYRFLTGRSLEFAALGAWQGTAAELATALFDATVTWDDIQALRDQWPGKLIIKGVQRVDDAERCISVGADAVVISNHGGRQLDRTPSPIESIPEFRRAVGESLELHVDGGFLSGSDVLAALALGADGVYLGRAYLYGLMAGGQAGVRKVLSTIRDELRTSMQLVGAESVASISSDMVRFQSVRRGS